MLSNSPDGETDTSRYFRAVFIQKMTDFMCEAKLLANDHAEFKQSWKDFAGREGLAIGAAVIVGVIAILGAVMVISAAASAGAAIPVAVAATVGGIAFYKYRDRVKQQRHQRVADMIDKEDALNDVAEIADLFVELYRMQISCCTIKDAYVLADSCVKGLSEEMLKNSKFNFSELLHKSSLQGVMVRALKKVPKVKLDMNVMSGKKLNTRGMIGHTAFYCKETDEFFQTEKSKSKKYGVLLFDTKSELQDYEAILACTSRRGDQWKFSRMRPHEVSVMKRSSLFRAYDNDEVFSRKSEQVENDIEIIDIMRELKF